MIAFICVCTASVFAGCRRSNTALPPIGGILIASLVLVVILAGSAGLMILVYGHPQ